MHNYYKLRFAKIVIIFLISQTSLFAQLVEHEQLEKDAVIKLIQQIGKSGKSVNDTFSQKGERNDAGNPNGKWIIYVRFNNSIEKRYEGYYKIGLKTGKWEIFNNYNRVEFREVWKENKLISWTYFPDDKVRRYHLECPEGISLHLAQEIQYLGLSTYSRESQATIYGRNSFDIKKKTYELICQIVKESYVSEGKVSFWGFKEQLLQEKYFQKGKETKMISYKYHLGKINQIETYKAGTIKEKVRYQPNTPNLKNLILYYNNGEIKETGQIEIEGGTKEGIWVGYYYTGIKKYYGNYKKDEKTGVWKEWDKSGNLVSKINFNKISKKKN